MRKRWAFILLAVVGAALAALFVARLAPGSSNASSHREAPLISEDPTADNTDLYAFRSPDKPNTLTIVSNWIPGEDPAAGPNYYTFSQSAKYNIYIDRNGDGKPDITYSFRFKTPTGPVLPRQHAADVAGDAERQGVRERQDADQQHRPALQRVRRRQGLRGRRGEDDRHASAASAIFAGQRDDPFFADVGAIFDLVAIRKAGTTGNMGGGKDFLSGYNVHTIALQIPIAQVDTQATRSASGRPPTART